MIMLPLRGQNTAALQLQIVISLSLVDRASFVNTLLLFQLDTLFYYVVVCMMIYLRLTSFVAISCVAARDSNERGKP